VCVCEYYLSVSCSTHDLFILVCITPHTCNGCSSARAGWEAALTPNCLLFTVGTNHSKILRGLKFSRNFRGSKAVSAPADTHHDIRILLLISITFDITINKIN